MAYPIRARRRLAGEEHALKNLRREIRANDPFLKRKYVREFTEAFQAYNTVISLETMFKAASAADIVLVGDYHALPIYQNLAEEIVIALLQDGSRPVLALESVYAEDQYALDDWQAGLISDEQLRKQIHFDGEWGFEWEPFRQLLNSARERSVPIYGLDVRPRGNFRKIANRDRHAACKLKEIRELHPPSPVVVLFGESHLAPHHLPAEINLGLPKEKVVTILQNIDELYWHAAAEKREQVPAVRVAKDVFCVFNATPLEKYHSYRLWIRKWQRTHRSHFDQAAAFYNLVDALLNFLNVGIETTCAGRGSTFVVDLYPEVHNYVAVEDYKRLLLRRGLAEQRILEVLHDLRLNKLVYVPELNSILTDQVEVAVAAHEAALFVHHACRGLENIQYQGESDPENLFYREVVERALARLGSLLIHPTRAVADSELLEIYSLTREQIEARTNIAAHEVLPIVDSILMHKDFEDNRKHYGDMPEACLHLAGLEGRRRKFAVTHLATMLSGHLYAAYLKGNLMRKNIRSIFFRRLNRPGAARALYFSLVEVGRRRSRLSGV